MRRVRVSLQDPHELKDAMCAFCSLAPPSLLSRALAKPRHNPHPLKALQSAALAARAQTPEECPSSGPGLCYSSPFGTHSHT